MSIALQQLPADAGNDYEDVAEALPNRHGHERQTQANAAYSSSFYRPPLPPPTPITTTATGGHQPNNDAASAASRPPLAEPLSAVNRMASLEREAVPKYSKVNKEKKSEEGGAESEQTSSPVIKSHYMSTNAAITEELNRLTSELESSLMVQS